MTESDVAADVSRGASELALIHAAERLFAEHGIAGVPLRQINQAANQKNISAAHYYFGSREGLVRAVLDNRWPALDRRRRERLQAAGGPRDLRFYVELMITSMAEELAPRPEGNHYLRFIQQYERNKGDYFVRTVSAAGFEIWDHIEAIIYYIPDAVRRMRMRYLLNMVLGVLAMAEQQLETGALTYAEVPLMTTNLIDMVTAGLAAPLSSATLDVLREAPAC